MTRESYPPMPRGERDIEALSELVSQYRAYTGRLPGAVNELKRLWIEFSKDPSVPEDTRHLAEVECRWLSEIETQSDAAQFLAQAVSCVAAQGHVSDPTQGP